MNDGRSITISKDLFKMLLFSNFRYSLGRSTYMPSLCKELFMEHWALIPHAYRTQIVGDIEHYLEHLTKHQHQCDIATWKQILEFAKENLNALEDIEDWIRPWLF